jgi:hypothetical protein
VHNETFSVIAMRVNKCRFIGQGVRESNSFTSLERALAPKVNCAVVAKRTLIRSARTLVVMAAGEMEQTEPSPFYQAKWCSNLNGETRNVPSSDVRNRPRTFSFKRRPRSVCAVCSVAAATYGVASTDFSDENAEVRRATTTKRIGSFQRRTRSPVAAPLV